MKIRINEKFCCLDSKFVMLILNDKIIKNEDKNKIIRNSIFLWIFMLVASVFLANLSNSIYGLNNLFYILLLIVISIVTYMIFCDLYFFKIDKEFYLSWYEVKELTQLTSVDEILEKLKLWGYLNNSTQK